MPSYPRHPVWGESIGADEIIIGIKEHYEEEAEALKRAA